MTDQLAAEERLARWMGVKPVVSWAVGTEDAYCLWDLGLKEAMDWVNSHEKYCIENGYGVRRCERWPAYSTDANAWPAVHAEIVKRDGITGSNLQFAYAHALYAMCSAHAGAVDSGAASNRHGPSRGNSTEVSQLLSWAVWCAATATPTQRLAAMMRVIEETEND